MRTIFLPLTVQGGIYLMQLTDYYIVTVGVILLAFIEALSTGIRYGAARLARNVREMTGHSPSPFLVVCWAGVTPMLILVI
jgi:Sodium:neurotransmitter symporter family